MTPNIHGKMVYSHEQPMWHAITEPSTVPMTAEEVLDKRFQGGFNIALRDITVFLNDENVATGDFAIVREKSPYDPKEVIFGYCTERYHVLQPREVAKSYDTNVCEKVETMAFLGKGEEMFISWAMPKISVRVGDEVEMYGIIRAGFDTLKSARLFTSCYRPVCANTINLAEGWARKNTSVGDNKGMIWKGKGVNPNLLRDLGYWLQHVQGKALQEAELLEGFFGKLAETPIKSDEQAGELVGQAYPLLEDTSGLFPTQLRSARAEKIADFNAGQVEIQKGILNLFGGAGTAITPDYWGLFNATTEYFCHVQPSKKPIAESVMFGGRQTQMMKMVKVLAK